MESFLTPYGLSNSGQEKLQFTPVFVWSQAGMLRRPSRRNYRKLFFCLRSYPGEVSHSNSPNRKLSNDISVLVVRRRKVALHTSSHLTPTEAWQSAVSTTSEGCRVSSEVRLENCTPVWGVGQIWRAWDSRLRKNSTSHLFWLVQDLSGFTHNTVTMYARLAMSFFCTFEGSYSSVLRPILLKLHM